MTMRNIIIGFQIIEYEQKSSDRALYGENTMKRIAEQLKYIKGISVFQLYRFRAFYLTYPQIFSAVMIKIKKRKYYCYPKFQFMALSAAFVLLF